MRNKHHLNFTLKSKKTLLLSKHGKSLLTVIPFFSQTMDEIDQTILRALRKNARVSRTKIAELVKISEAAVRKRIKKLEKEGIILGYSAILNYRKINLVHSFTGIDVEPQNLLEVVRTLRDDKNISSIFLTSGDHDILVEIICNSIKELEEIHNKISKIDGVKRVCPAIVNDIIELKK